MEPTTLYVKPMLNLLSTHQQAIHAMAHITGGGLQENIIRVIPQHLGVEINTHSWTLPAVFQWLQHEGHVDSTEMWRTFNCGIGFVLVVAPGMAASIGAALATHALSHWTIGHVVPSSTDGMRVHIA